MQFPRLPDPMRTFAKDKPLVKLTALALWLSPFILPGLTELIKAIRWWS